MLKNETGLELLKKNNWVEKQNILNEMKSNQMTLQEIRFFSIYLSKINARDINTRVVDFSLLDFLKIMNIDKVNISCLESTLSSLLSKVVFTPNEKKGFTGFQLFKKCDVYQDELTEQYRIKIDAHDDALPLLFNFKEQYFKYELWNALNLRSANQIRMYEILKQYETVGIRIIKLNELKKLLGVNEKSYHRFNSFRESIIDTAKTALLQYTDICFEYETIKAGRRVTALKFFISKNEKCKKRINLDEFIHLKEAEPEIQYDSETSNIDYEGYADLLENEFTIPQVEVLYHMAVSIVDKEARDSNDFVIKMCHYLRLLYKRLKSAPNEVKHKFAYVKKLIECDLENMSH